MLEDVTVLELGSSTSSAYCGKLLVDAGAAVLRPCGSERPGQTGAYWTYLHQGKSEMRLPLEGDLARSVDVVVYDGDNADQTAQVNSLRGIQENFVVVSLSDYGLDGPFAAIPASELTLQAEAGIVALHPTGERPPVRCGVDLAALTSGICAAMGVATALVSRDAGAPRVDVDVSRFEALTSILQYPWLFDQIPDHYPYPVPQNAVPGIERALDGWVCIVAITPQQWSAFKAFAGVPALEDQRFDSPSERIRLSQEVTKHIREFTESRTVGELVVLGAAHRVPIVPVGTPESAPELVPYATRGAYERHPDGFLRPRAPFQIKRGRGSRQHSGNGVSGVGSAVARGRMVDGDPGQPLAGLRVVEFGTFQAGPLATAHLAELGADVIKIESVKRPDLIRFTGSPFTVDRFWERSASFAGVNLGKRAITADLSTDDGLEIIRRLIAQSDVLVENYSPRVLEQCGLGYEAIRAIQPDIVMIRMPAWGLDGQWRDWPGFTYSANATSGLSSLTGYPDGEPLLTGTVIDPIAGFLAAFVALCAIRGGEGALIEIPLCDVAAQLTAESVVEASSTGQVRARSGNRTPDGAPAGIYRCADQTWLAISVHGDLQWEGLSRLTGLDVHDPRFADLDGRLQHHDELDRLLVGYFAGRQSPELLSALRQRRIPAATVNVGVEVVEHPQLVARQRIRRIRHPVFGDACYVGLPMRLSPVALPPVHRAAPLLGQDNEAVLSELGYDRSDIERLTAAKVIGSVPG